MKGPLPVLTFARCGDPRYAAPEFPSSVRLAHFLFRDRFIPLRARYHFPRESKLQTTFGPGPPRLFSIAYRPLTNAAQQQVLLSYCLLPIVYRLPTNAAKQQVLPVVIAGSF